MEYNNEVVPKKFTNSSELKKIFWYHYLDGIVKILNRGDQANCKSWHKVQPQYYENLQKS
jgi:RNA polymerase-interacting CarD/CdnL/TRCF family regulator